jgi:hypothetical protein
MTAQPLVNGAVRESYLGLPLSQIHAIVEVVDPTRPDGSLCSAALVAPEWVVTARHCLQIPSPAVVVQGLGQGPLAVLAVLGTAAHPNADVALLRVDTSAADAGLSGIVPIAAGGSSLPPLAAGDVVEMAGYGLTEDRTARALRFLAESITSLDTESIHVSGFGANGACEGDSGGPLLVRAQDGTAFVIGVLSSGSATCVGDDTYTRLDGIRDWIESVIGPHAVAPRDCGTITAQGRCLYGSALWCSASELAAEACAAGEGCGWNRAQAAFRCVDRSADPCDGVDAIGACKGGNALSCESGVLRRQACVPCQACRIDGKTGSPMCAAP